jgi:hypothetical protein
MSKETGGAAFPNPGIKDISGARTVYISESQGMTLRDWFAGQALMGMIASEPVADRSKPIYAVWAEKAFKFADAMLAERDKP